MTTTTTKPRKQPRAVTTGIRAVLAQATAEDWASGLSWYARALATAEQLADEYGVSVDAACGVIAALSPMQGWAGNLSDAVTVLSCNEGQVRCSAYGANVRKAQAIRDGESPDAILGGLKVRSFYANILSGGTDDGVTIDRHAIAAAGFKLPESGSISKGTYDAASRSYWIVAKEHGITGAQLQAVVWVAWRRLKGVSAQHG